jgi:lipoyl synthase
VTERFAPKPPWLKVRAPGGDVYHRLKQTFRQLDLATVCEEARCPNVGECWREGTATVMLLGEVCTRGCRFCAVTTGDPRGAVDSREPEHVAKAISQLELSYVVLTMVDRDDLLDGGAAHVARTVSRLRELRRDILVETLVGDFHGHLDAVDTVVDGGPHVFAHNVEVVRRLQRSVRDVRCGYEQTLAVLRRARERLDRSEAPRGSLDRSEAPRGSLDRSEAPRGSLDTAEPGAPALDDGAFRGRRLTKSSIMVGIGETDDEVIECMRDLREAGVDIVTVGQYLRPTPKHHAVERFVTPDVFADYQRQAMGMGFLYAASGPLVRSSYKAAEVFVRGVLGAAPGGLAEAEVGRTLEERLVAARREAARLAERGAEPALMPAASLLRRPAQVG